MLDPQEIPELRTRMRERAEQDRRILETLQEEVRPLKNAVRRISPRSATAMSLVASDGGNNKIQFDPFLMQIVRVVDSFGHQLCLDVVSPTTDTDELSARQFGNAGQPPTALGHMMRALGVEKLYKLSPAVPTPRMQQDEQISPSWVLVYRDLCEWAVLHERICRTEFSTDTLMVRDGFLRAKIFSGALFMELRRLLADGIEQARRERKRKLYLVGVAKHSKVLARYKLAMAIEEIMAEPYPCFVRVPRPLEAKAYVWPEYARGAEAEGEEREAPKFVAGVMYLVKFGANPRDPIWAVDVFDPQAPDEAIIFGHLLADSMDGFPVPLYPRCLQKAHEHAALVDFDMDILEEEVFRAVRAVLPSHNADALDILRFNPDPSNQRYE
jgi:hypothetical protein